MLTAKTCSTLEGSGPPVALIHGVGLDHTMWGPVVSGLHDSCSVLRYDLIGHGRSTASTNAELTMTDLVQQLEYTLDQHRIDRTVVVGFSLGALVAQAFASTRPERVVRLALLNSVYRRSPAQLAAVLSRLNQLEIGGADAVVEAAVRRWFTDRYRLENAHQVARIETRLRTNDVQGLTAAYRLFARFPDDIQLHLITAPTLVITGADDVGSTAEMSAAIAAAIPNAELQVLPGAKHGLPLENADILTTLLRRFVLEEDRS